MDSFFRCSHLLAILAVAVGLSGCAPKTPPLTMLGWEQGADTTLVRKMVAEFSKESGIRVQLVIMDTEEECRVEFEKRTKQSNTPDLCMISSSSLAWWTNGGHIQNLSRYRPNEAPLLPEVVEPFSGREGMYAMPYGWSTLLLYYNKSLFERHALATPRSSWDWADLLHTAELLTVNEEGSSEATQYGLELGAEAEQWLPFVWQNHGEILGADGGWSLTDPQFSQSNTQAMEYYADLVRKEAVACAPALSNGTSTWKDAFIHGKAAMIFAHREFGSRLQGKVPFDWEICAMPKGQQSCTWLEVYGYAITARSDRGAESWNLITFLCKGNSQASRILNGSHAPALRELITSKLFLDFPGAQPIYNQALTENLKLARAAPRTELWNRAQVILTEEMTALIRQPDASTRETLERMQTRLDEMNLLFAHKPRKAEPKPGLRE